MPEFDISMHGIVVLLSQAYYGEPRHKSPIDVEGTVLSMIDHSKSGYDMIKQGRFIELICDAQWNGSTDIHIRWENDQKEWYAGGTMILRRAKVSFCSSIWTSNTRVEVDTRLYHELKSNYYQRPTMLTTKKASLFTYNDPPILNKTYDHITHIPYDAMWHRCIYEGVLSWARKIAGGFEYKENADNAILHYVANAEAEEAPDEVITNEPPVQEQYHTIVHNDDGDPIDIVKSSNKIINKYFYDGSNVKKQGGNLRKGSMVHEAIDAIQGITTNANTSAKMRKPTEYKWAEGISNVSIKGDTLVDFEDLTGKWEGNITPKSSLSDEEIAKWDANTNAIPKLSDDENDKYF